jgi:hypothetical protein
MEWESLVAIALLVGIIWGAVIFLRGGLLAGGMTVLLAGTCFGYFAMHISAGPVPITSDRILWTLLMVQVVVWWRLGLTASHRMGRSEWLLLAFIGVLAVNVAMHDWSINRDQPISQFVFYYLMPLGMYWVGWKARISERGLKTMFALLGVFGVYLALTAIAEKWQVTALVFPSYIGDGQKYPEFFWRARGPLLNPAANGMLLGLCLGGGLMAWPRMPRWGQLLLIAFCGLVCFGILCTMTRSAWMGGALGLFLLVFFGLPRLYRPWFLAMSVVLVTISAIVVTQFVNILEFKRDRDVSAQDTASSVELRPVLAVIAWEMFCDRPLVGCGLGHYLDEHRGYLSNRDSGFVLEKGRDYVQHNIFLSLLTETGLLGLVPFVLLLVVWLQSAWRLWRSTGAPLWMRQQGLFFLVLAANYLVNGMVQDMTIIPMIHSILFFMAGVTVNVQLQAADCRNATFAVVPGGQG